MNESKIINVHAHIFTHKNVPVNFLPLLLRPVAGWLKNEKLASALSWISEKIFRQRHWAELISRYHHFIAIGEEKTQEGVLKDLIAQYPKGTKFAILTMDMEYMGAGKVPQPFTEQLEELAALKRKPAYKDIIYPFIFVHPERPNIFELVKQYIEVENFAGIKLYPPLGYFPFDSRLDAVFEYAEKKGIPITTHCARGGVFYKGKITDDMLIHPISGKRLEKNSNKYFTDVYTDPLNYVYLLKKFPQLKINLAHCGGFDEWKKFIEGGQGEVPPTWYETVCKLMEGSPNVYADVSYTLYTQELYPQLRVMLGIETFRNKVLFGSDFYMVQRETTEKEFYLRLRAYLGDEKFKQIAEINPVKFLSL